MDSLIFSCIDNMSDVTVFMHSVMYSAVIHYHTKCA